MSSITKVHIIDADSRRRAQIAHRLARSSVRAEIYETIEELASYRPTSGLLLINRDDDAVTLDTLASTMAARGDYLPFAVYSSNPAPRQVVDAMLSGALDYLVWPFESGEVEASLARIAQRSAQTADLERKRASARVLVDKLSPREKQVLVGMIDGLSNKDIGARLGISPRTAEIHRANMGKKLGVSSSAEAVRVGLYADLDQA